ncbi:hypothetical protein JCGZ_15337 [Jatropha curcas]|uniref:Uncharacterized protein n=1 Tax=Jatropha curcas TaxID=180498 RepID=A0A067K5Q4_JATCU|nr:hypothetical protein JCGZ_15337 [Jatropha curcas]
MALSLVGDGAQDYGASMEEDDLVNRSNHKKRKDIDGDLLGYRENEQVEAGRSFRDTLLRRPNLDEIMEDNLAEAETDGLFTNEVADEEDVEDDEDETYPLIRQNLQGTKMVVSGEDNVIGLAGLINDPSFPLDHFKDPSIPHPSDPNLNEDLMVATDGQEKDRVVHATPS